MVAVKDLSRTSPLILPALSPLPELSVTRPSAVRPTPAVVLLIHAADLDQGRPSRHDGLQRVGSGSGSSSPTACLGSHRAHLLCPRCVDTNDGGSKVL